MNRNIIISVIASMLTVVSCSEAKMMENCKIELVNGRFHWVKEEGVVVTLEEQEKNLGIPAGLKLPTTKEEMDKFYENYATNSSVQLAYCSTNFAQIDRRSALLLVFSCTLLENLDAWLKDVCTFLGLIKTKEDPFFDSDIKEFYINLWLKTLDEISLSRSLLIDFERIKNSLKIN